MKILSISYTIQYKQRLAPMLQLSFKYKDPKSTEILCPTLNYCLNKFGQYCRYVKVQHHEVTKSNFQERDMHLNIIECTCVSWLLRLDSNMHIHY